MKRLHHVVVGITFACGCASLAIAAPPAGPTLPPAAANARLNSTIAGDHLGDVAASRAAAAVSGDRLGDIAASRAASAQTRLSEVAANQQASQAISRAADLTSRAAEAQNQDLRRDGQETAAAARLRSAQPTALPIGPPINPHDEALRRQLASIDRMRDEAVARGDARLLERADMLEQAARDRFAQFESSRLNQVQSARESREPRFSATTLELTEPLGPGFGRQSASEARGDGRTFGQNNSEIARQRQGNEPFANLPTFDEPVGPGYGRLTANDARQGLHRLPPTDGGTTEPSPTDPTGFDPIDPVLPDPIESPEPETIEPLDFEPLAP